MEAFTDGRADRSAPRVPAPRNLRRPCRPNDANTGADSKTEMATEMITSPRLSLLFLALTFVLPGCSDPSGMPLAERSQRPGSPAPPSIPDDASVISSQPPAAEPVGGLSGGGQGGSGDPGGGGGAPVPEPMTLLLLGGGLAGTALYRRRARASGKE